MTAKNETARLAAVRRYAILDTPPDGTFDKITMLAARFFDVPIAVVSIVDHDRIWFKSKHGLDARQVGRDPGLCTSAILRDGATIIGDTKLDPRCLTNPLVAGEFGLRFYAAAPLITAEGFKLGTLCVMDKEPRELSANQAKVLESMASVVMDELELRLAARESARNTQSLYDRSLAQETLAEQRFRQAFDFAPIGMAILSLDFLLLEVNRSFCEMFGYREGNLLLTGLRDLMHPDDADACIEDLSKLSAGKQRSQKTECRLLHAGGDVLHVRMTLSSTVEGSDAHPTRIIVQAEIVKERMAQVPVTGLSLVKGSRRVELPS